MSTSQTVIEDRLPATIAYIDGFNFYYGAVKGTPYKWLDFEALCRRLLPRDNIVKIRYFTARVSAKPTDPHQVDRQSAYLRALASQPLIEIHYGHFVTRNVRLPLARPPAQGPRTVEVLRTEEKGSDVNLAAYLLRDAFTSRCDTAVRVQQRLRTSLRLSASHAQTLASRVGIVNPHPVRHRSRMLEGTFFKQLRRNVLAQCQLAPVVQDSQGEIHKPSAW